MRWLAVKHLFVWQLGDFLNQCLFVNVSSMLLRVLHPKSNVLWQQLLKLLFSTLARTCVDIPTIPRFGIALPLQQNYSCGQKIEFVCHRGYKLTGSSSTVCQSDGKFSSSSPECQGKYIRQWKRYFLSTDFSKPSCSSVFFSVKLSDAKIRHWSKMDTSIPTKKSMYMRIKWCILVGVATKLLGKIQ